MERLKYIVEDRTIAELLGVQNFTNEESAILELVKNAYDAHAKNVSICFGDNSICIIDNGIGMDKDTIYQHWMHVGKSDKGYSTANNSGDDERVLAGSKGIGRFALARLGASVVVYSVKENSNPVKWTTDWNESILDDWDNKENMPIGTHIFITSLRDKWSERKISRLIDYLSITYNDDRMAIEIIPDIGKKVHYYFSDPILGKNCVSKIKLFYDSEKKHLRYVIDSDEFILSAKEYCSSVDLYHFEDKLSVLEELSADREIDLSDDELDDALKSLGDFYSELYFSLKSSTKKDCESFLYKYDQLPERYENGVVLYRNAFSISSFDGTQDWLGFNKRTRQSPAAATHLTGSWRVRGNQISGKVIIDKKENPYLRDLSNRQGLEENDHYKLFVKVIIAGVAAFERYRQSIIRAIDKKNKITESPQIPLIEQILKNPERAKGLSTNDALTLVHELDAVKEESESYKEEKKNTEERYRYDVRILNVLATSGLKGASIAHEMKNDRNSVSVNYDYIVSALKEYSMWDELNSPECTEYSYKNVPQLLNRNKEINQKIVVFMDTMLDEIKKQKFTSHTLCVFNSISAIRANWIRDYASLNIIIDIDEAMCFDTSEDVFSAIFDNLILNSWQQNKSASKINISISIQKVDSCLRQYRTEK